VTVSNAFELLHPGVQRWIWSRQWTELRDAQERATVPILAADHDVIIAAATASGKTEAAFLPICSALLDGSQPGPGVQALYISPLKALINDQYGRLDDLCEQIDLAVHRWHGDVPGARKHKVLPSPVDRARAGSKHHLITDACGVPLAVLLTGGNRHDSTQLLALVHAVQKIRGTHGRPRQHPRLYWSKTRL
jgi:hypothetical protein